MSTKKLQIVGSVIPVANWNQNDSTANDYIKNRPFYTEIETKINRDIIPSQEITFQSNGNNDTCTLELGSLPIIDKQAYKLILDGAEYQITAIADTTYGDDELIFGNLNLFSSDFANTGEPFYGIINFDYDDSSENPTFNLYLKTNSNSSSVHTIQLSVLEDAIPLLGEGTHTFGYVYSKHLDEFSGTGIQLTLHRHQFVPTQEDKFILTFNNQTYDNITLFNYDGDPGYGNLSIIDKTFPDTEEDFLLLWNNNDDAVYLFINLPEGEYEASLKKIIEPIEVEKIHKVSGKMIEHMPYTEIKKFSNQTVPLQKIYVVNQEVSEGSDDYYPQAEDLWVGENSVPLIPGKNYKVTLDNATFSLIPITAPFIGMYLGNISLFPAEYLEYFESLGINVENTGEPFCYAGHLIFDKTKINPGIYNFSITCEDEIGETVPLINNYTYEPENSDGSQEFSWSGGIYTSLDNKFRLTLDGKVYNVIFDYQYDSKGSQICAGNKYLYSLAHPYEGGTFPDTGEDYFIETYSDETEIRLYCRTNDTPHTITFEVFPKEITHKLDPKYFDVNVTVPYTEDDEDNIIFEKDVYVDNNTSVRNISENVSILQDNVRVIMENIANNSNGGSNNSGTNENYTSQLNEGIALTYLNSTYNSDMASKGLSANKKAIPTAESAWIEGVAAPSLDFTGRYGAYITKAPFLSVTETISGKSTTTTKAINIDWTAGGVTLPYTVDDYIELVFEDAPNSTYYVQITSIEQPVSEVTIDFSFVNNNTFDVSTAVASRPIKSLIFHTKVGNVSHSENDSIARSDYAHAEGLSTEANGQYSHSEGIGTIASGHGQHVQGSFNIEDTKNKYAHIVGNGSDFGRSNAHTLDWDGNAWYAGSIEAVNGIIVKSSTEGSTKRFKITIDDSGTFVATEIVEEVIAEE